MMNRCGDHFASVIAIHGDWAEYQITFATLAQKGWGKNGVTALDTSAIYALRFKGETDFDISLDDIRFTQ